MLIMVIMMLTTGIGYGVRDGDAEMMNDG